MSDVPEVGDQCQAGGTVWTIVAIESRVDPLGVLLKSAGRIRRETYANLSRVTLNPLTSFETTVPL